MNLCIGICDDEVKEIENIKKIVSEYFLSQGIDSKIITFSSPQMLINEYESLDILFLDIEMPGLNGLDVAEEIRRDDDNVRIVFLTNHREYIQKAFTVRAYRYLYKPYRLSEILEVLNNVVKETMTVSGIYLKKKNGERFLIKFCYIYYIEAMGDSTAVFFKDNNIVTQKTLKYWTEVVPEDFMQCHKSFIVNMYYITKLTNTNIILRNHREIPLSVRKRVIMRNKYFEYIRSTAKGI